MSNVLSDFMSSERGELVGDQIFYPLNENYRYIRSHGVPSGLAPPPQVQLHSTLIIFTTHSTRGG